MEPSQEVLQGRFPRTSPVGRLPAAKRAPCHAMTADGERHAFVTPEQLVRWAARKQDVTAVCLDSCAWRDYEQFAMLLRRGLQPQEAFERTELYSGVQATRARRRMFSAA